MPSKVDFDFKVTRWDLTFEGEAQGSYTPGTPDVMYLRNGDPGHPGDPPEFYLNSATLKSIEGQVLPKAVPITDLDEFNNSFYETLLEQATEELKAQDDSHAERMAEDWREQQREREQFFPDD